MEREWHLSFTAHAVALMIGVPLTVAPAVLFTPVFRAPRKLGVLRHSAGMSGSIFGPSSGTALGRTTNTGQGASRTTASATELQSTSVIIPRRPWVPTTIKSASRSAAI